MKKIIFLVLFLVLINFCYAANQVFVSQIKDSLEIEFTPLPVIKAGESYDLKVRVFNGSTGFPINKYCDCFFDLYNESLDNIVNLSQNTPTDLFDYEFKIGGNNFSKEGYYPYIIQCNTSTHGSFFAGYIEATENGELPKDNDKNNLNIIISIGLIIICLLWVSFNLETEHTIFKIMSIFFSFIALFLLSGVTLLNSAIGETMYKFYNYFFVFIWLYIATFFIYWILKKMGVIVGGKE